jgi:DNA-binding response OmpR family regulator
MEKLLLVVDDSRTIRHAVEMAFRSTEFSVVLAQGADDAFKCIEDRKPDLVFVDAKMDGVDGYELCKRLKAREELSETPVLLMVDEAGPDEARADDCDIDGYVIKPFHCSDLIDPARMLTGGVVKHDVPLSFEQVLAARQLQARQESMPSRVARDGEEEPKADREVEHAMAGFDALEAGPPSISTMPSPHLSADLVVPIAPPASTSRPSVAIEPPVPPVSRSVSGLRTTKTPIAAPDQRPGASLPAPHPVIPPMPPPGHGALSAEQVRLRAPGGDPNPPGEPMLPPPLPAPFSGFSEEARAGLSDEARRMALAAAQGPDASASSPELVIPHPPSPEDAGFTEPPPRFPPPLPDAIEPASVVERRSEVKVPVETPAHVTDPAEAQRPPDGDLGAKPVSGPLPIETPVEASSDAQTADPLAPAPGPSTDLSPDAAALRSPTGDLARRRSTDSRATPRTTRQADRTSALLIALVVALALALVALGVVLSRL